MHVDNMRDACNRSRRDEVFEDETIYSDYAVNFTPFLKDGRVGYRVDKLVGSDDVISTYVYFNPSDSVDDGIPNVFIYQGVANDPCQDSPDDHHIIEFATSMVDQN